ncbi:MAG: YitT family protein [Syntrophomonadaceae bacterium]|nr:YitT family protein [Syntrophomonadaceae bacterium]
MPNFQESLHHMRDDLVAFTERISLRDLLGILLGSAIVAVGMQGVIIPAGLLTGGVSGVAIIVARLTAWDIGLLYLLMNIPIFIAGFRSISYRFALYSLVGTLSLSGFLTLFAWLGVNFGVDDLLLSTVLGGVITGLGSGINLRCHGSGGGLDIIAVMMKRYRGVNIGSTMMAGNIIVLAAFLFFSNIEMVLFSAIGFFISSRTIDAVESGLSVTKTAFIISSQNEEIRTHIMENLHRGCTIIDGHGGWSGQDYKVIMVTVARNQLPHLKEIVFTFDQHAFVIVHDSTEVIGRGFKAGDADF